MPTAWNQQLRDARRNLGLSTRDLAARAGMSDASVRAYELGRRRPTREHLLRLLHCMHIDVRSRNEILAAAGFSSDARDPTESPMSLDEALEVINGRPWPAFIVNDMVEVVAANDFFRGIAGMPRMSRRRAVRRNALNAATLAWVAAMAVDWDEFLTGMIEVFKARNPEPETLDAPSPYFAALLEALLAGDPALIRRFVALWEATPAREPPKPMWSYRTAWRYPGDHTVRFLCTVYSVNDRLGLEIHDWIPADAESHRELEEAASRASKRTAGAPSS